MMMMRPIYYFTSCIFFHGKNKIELTEFIKRIKFLLPIFQLIPSNFSAKVTYCKKKKSSIERNLNTYLIVMRNERGLDEIEF